MTNNEHTSASYREEADAIWRLLETADQDEDEEVLNEELLNRWRYARQRAEELWDSGN